MLLCATVISSAAMADGMSSTRYSSSMKSSNMSGFQAGITYTPRGGTTKSNVSISGQNVGATILTAAYNTAVDGITLGVSAVYGFNTFLTDNTNTVDKFNVGCRVAYKGFTVSAAYKDPGGDQTGKDDMTVWGAGVAYETGPYGVSLSYISTTKDAFDYSTLLLSGVYNMAAGVDAFATIGMGDYEKDAASKNDGYAVVDGMILSL